MALASASPLIFALATAADKICGKPSLSQETFSLSASVFVVSMSRNFSRRAFQSFQTKVCIDSAAYLPHVVFLRFVRNGVSFPAQKKGFFVQTNKVFLCKKTNAQKLLLVTINYFCAFLRCCTQTLFFANKRFFPNQECL